MKVSTLVALSRQCEPGQIEYQAKTGALWFTEYPGEDEEQSADVTALVDSLEQFNTIDEILTACSDYVYERFCVDCKTMQPDELTRVESELACFADVVHEHICDDCAQELSEGSCDDYTRNGVSRWGF